MKTAIYIEEGVTQLVLTPENDFERSSMAVIAGKPLEVKLFHGTFYDCRGGWTRQTGYYPSHFEQTGDYKYQSIILRIAQKKETDEQTNSA